MHITVSQSPRCCFQMSCFGRPTVQNPKIFHHGHWEFWILIGWNWLNWLVQMNFYLPDGVTGHLWCACLIAALNEWASIKLYVKQQAAIVKELGARVICVTTPNNSREKRINSFLMRTLQIEFHCVWYLCESGQGERGLLKTILAWVWGTAAGKGGRTGEEMQPHQHRK